PVGIQSPPRCRRSPRGLLAHERSGLEHERNDLLVDVLEHLGEELERLHLVLDERIALAVSPEPDPFLHLIELAEVLRPLLVDDVEHGRAFERVVDDAASRAHGFIHLDHGTEQTAPIGEVDKHARRALVLILLQHLLHPLGERTSERLALPAIELQRTIVDELPDAILPEANKLLAVHLYLEGELPENLRTHLIEVAVAIMPLDDLPDDFLQHFQDLAVEALALQRVQAPVAHDLSLGIEDVVVLQLPLPNRKVVLLDLLLGALDALVHPWVGDDLALLQAEPIHHLGDAIRAEQPHEVVLEGDVELALARVTLTAGSAAKLKVDAAALVALRAENRQSATFADTRAQLDVRSAAGHVRGDGHGAHLPRLGHDLRFRLRAVSPGVQHVVLDARALQHPAERLGDLNGGRTHEHRLSVLVVLLDFLDRRTVLLALRLVDEVVFVDTSDGFVRGDDHDIHLVDLPELLRLRLGRTRHARELLVHAEVVLQRDGGVGLRRRLNLYVFLGLDGLMEAVRIPPPGEHTAGVLVNDLHAPILHDVLDVFLVQRVGLQKLLDGVQPLGALGIEVVEPALLVLLLLLQESEVVH